MSILVFPQTIQKENEEKKSKREPITSNPFFLPPFSIWYATAKSPVSFPTVSYVVHRGGIALSKIDLALMRERYPVVLLSR